MAGQMEKVKAAMSPRERFLCALGGGTPDVVPFAEQFVGGSIPHQLLGIPAGQRFEPGRLADVMHNDVIKFSRYPPLFYERVPMEGGEVGVGPGQIRTRDDLKLMIAPAGEAWIDEARHFLKTQVGDRASAGGTRLGISATLNSMGLDNFSIALYEDMALVEEVVDFYLRLAKRTVEVFCDLGFDFIWCFDDFAFKTGPMFSPDLFREFFVPRLKPVTEAIRIPWIFHSDGNLFPVMDDLLVLGMAGIHPIEPEAMSLAEAKRVLQGRACVLGNISVDLLASGTPEQVRHAVREAVAAGAPGGGYVLTSGNCIPAYAKIENVRALIDAAADARGIVR
jgi:uroporphyrinogen decarboxylase